MSVRSGLAVTRWRLSYAVSVTVTRDLLLAGPLDSVCLKKSAIPDGMSLSRRPVR
ncbi:hypothetical protein D3C80_2128110 [compost metagenome]